MTCVACSRATDTAESGNQFFLGRNSDSIPFFKCSHCGAIFYLIDGIAQLARRPESGKRFVPITSGLFFLGLAIAMFAIWGANILTIVVGGLVGFFGWSCLKIGIWGSKELIDEMALDGGENQSENAKQEWDRIVMKK